MIVVSDTSPLTALLTVGEAEAIELARELHADRLLIDERKGRKLAVEEGVAVIGLLAPTQRRTMPLMPHRGPLLKKDFLHRRRCNGRH